MRLTLGTYEAEVRLGLVVIVLLLLVLNISTIYLLHHVKRQLTAEIDDRLDAALTAAARYTENNQTAEIESSQGDLFGRQYGITGIRTHPFTTREIDSLPASLGQSFAGESEFPGLEKDAMDDLLAGHRLFRFGKTNDVRFGLVVAQISPGRKSLILVGAEASIVGRLGDAARTAFYVAAAILILIIVLVISIPRHILKPFKLMRETARSAGMLIPSDGKDDVAEVIRSYEIIIGELKNNGAELERLYRESSSKVDRLERINDYILESIGAGVVNVDLGGRVIGFNRAASEILGYDPQLIVGRHYLTAFSQVMQVSLLFDAVLQRGEATGPREIELTREDGAQVWLGAECSIIYDDHDRVVGATAVLTDMTELKKLQNDLETNRRLAALGEMTAGLAHQLRNSLAAISGFCQLLQKKSTDHPALNEIAGSIRGEANTSETMISRFLTFARPLSLVEETLNLKQLLTECTRKFSVEIESKDISLTVDCAGEEITVSGDRLLLKEVLCNVLDNAVQAAGRGGEICVRVEMAQSSVVVTITDDGPGIPEALRGKLFTPFVSSKPSGTGLGLALTHKIVSLHQGSVSLGPGAGRGAVCRIELPAWAGNRMRPPVASAATHKNQ